LVLDNKDIESIIKILHDAAQVIMQYYIDNDYTAQNKKDSSPVTSADLDSDRLITTRLKALFPDIPIVSEESGSHDYNDRKSYQYLWLLDPLDGTKEFLNKTGDFSINLALIHGQKPILGFIYLPISKEVFVGIKGKGSYLYSHEGEEQKLKVNTFSLDNEGIKIVTSRHHLDAHTQSSIESLNKPEIIAAGGALKFLKIATGDADYYPRMIHIMEWDTAAGQIIIEEAGGQLVDITTGQPLVYNKPTLKNPHFLASGKIFHDTIQI